MVGPAVLVVLVVVTAALAVPARAGAADGDAASRADPAALVDTFVGTGSTPVPSGAIDTFPGADVPFGMVQWSPDTTPDRPAGGGYEYADDRISGFSLTHLSGPGCPIFGDVPVLPFTGALPADPDTLTEPFSHQDEHASPGRFEVDAGSPAVATRLAVTERSGIGAFTFPAPSPASAPAGLVFKLSDSATGVTHTSVRLVGDDQILGSVTSGDFCGVKSSYTVYFAATFEHPFTDEGVWDSAGLHPGRTTCAGTAQAGCGAWISFDVAADPTVTMKVGLSYVSTAGAALNRRVEDPGWRIGQVERDATASWDAALGRITVHGGSLDARRTFETALYHSLLDPSVFSDADGRYRGLDGRVHRSHRVHYANFSEWDIYRTEIPLLSLIEPGRVSDMMQSLIDDGSQAGSLPVWELAASDAGTMDGDSADPIIAEAYSFGVRGFDVGAALDQMVAGATRPLTFAGVEQRPFLGQFDDDGYVPSSVTGQDGTFAVGASITLEYALDDFAVARLAGATGHTAEARRMMAEAQDWEQLFNPATGDLQARQSDGSFPAGPAFQATPPALEAAGQNQFGFQEGNAIQYTWSVPQDLGELFALMGGDAAATRQLEQFFDEVNAGPFVPYDWSGDEPDFWVPWEFDASGAPWRTQQEVHRIATTVYSLSPDGEPGNDDLGAMSAWYVWADLGLYPLTPGTGDLVVGSPTFPSATVELAAGRRLTITAAGTPGVYVRSATVATGSGGAAPLDRPWLPAAVARQGGTLHFVLGPTPNERWGAGPAAAPPSYDEQATPLVGFTLPSGALPDPSPGPADITVGIESTSRRPQSVQWTATASRGISVSPPAGRIEVPVATAGEASRRATATVQVTSTAPTGGTVRFTFSAPGSAGAIPPSVIDVGQ